MILLRGRRSQVGKVAQSSQRLFELLGNDFEPDLSAGSLGSFGSFGSFSRSPKALNALRQTSKPFSN